MDFIELKTESRTVFGKGAARKLRSTGIIPAILYGPGSDTMPLMLNTHTFRIALQKNSGTPIFNLTIGNDQEISKFAMLKELQTDPLSRQILHADFYELSMDRKIKAKVPVVIIGKCIGIEMGGMLQTIRREIEVFCLPSEIPEKIELDVTDLSIGDSIHINDIKLDGDLEIPNEANFTILTVLSPKLEEEEETEETEEGEEGEEGEEKESEEDDVPAGKGKS